jgi:hypothetical protein
MNGESAKHISQINLDLRQDTLFIDVFKKMVFLRNSVINSATTNWKIKLVPDIKFVAFSGKVLPLSELAVYPQKGLEQNYYPSIEIFPKKFPYVAK